MGNGDDRGLSTSILYRCERGMEPFCLREARVQPDTHAHCIPGRVAGRNDLNYIVNSGKTHCT